MCACVCVCVRTCINGRVNAIETVLFFTVGFLGISLTHQVSLVLVRLKVSQKRLVDKTTQPNHHRPLIQTYHQVVTIVHRVKCLEKLHLLVMQAVSSGLHAQW